jgi:hypothetical protein
MRWGSKQWNRIVLCLAVACVAALMARNASAVATKQLFRATHNQAFQGLCCFSFLESVQVQEPPTPVPVIVTWSTDYQATGTFLVELSLNGSTCRFFGPGSIQPFGVGDGSGRFESRYFQWLISPSDGLLPGNNKITLCGGATASQTAVLFLGLNTLTVRTTK